MLDAFLFDSVQIFLRQEFSFEVFNLRFEIEDGRGLFLLRFGSVVFLFDLVNSVDDPCGGWSWSLLATKVLLIFVGFFRIILGAHLDLNN